jgi:hypothetical protein
MKEEQKKHLIDMMKEDEKLGLYEYIGVCEGNNGDGCFMDSSGHDCGCHTRVVKQEPKLIHEQIIDLCGGEEKFKEIAGLKPKQEIKLEDVFNDEKKQGVKDVIYAQKQETLEEASWKYNPLKKLDGEFLRHAFKEGAKWQSERMYSEEEVLVKLYECLGHFAYHHNIVINGNEINEWFEQFKNK